jgi:hypothetical protein
VNAGHISFYIIGAMGYYNQLFSVVGGGDAGSMPAISQARGFYKKQTDFKGLYVEKLIIKAGKKLKER